MSDDSAFFEELQGEFLNEAAFMLEQYEEQMLGLESADNRQESLTNIFRVAHSVKGGASAVGLTDLAHFAHVMEDLLAILRDHPEYVEPAIISELLKSGDMLKKRVAALQAGDRSEWHTEEMKAALKVWLEKLSADQPQKVFTEMSIEEAQQMSEESPSMEETPALEEIPMEVSEQEPAPLVESLPSEPVEAAIAEVHEIKPVIEKSPSLPKTEAKKPAEADGKKRNLGTAIKVDLARVDSVLDAVGELVVLKNQLVHDEVIRMGGHARLESIVDQLDKSVRELYDKTLSIRMTPLKSLFLKIQRIVRDLSISLNKPVDLQMFGEETEVERAVFEILGDPLVHLVRNAMDHGVENQDLRKERNKNSVAKVTVSAKQSGGTVVIEIVDDGGGISKEKVLKKAKEKGLIRDGITLEEMTDEQVFGLILSPGFSTADKVSDLSGRGVGLDVVKSNLDRINGKIDIQSKLYEGTTFRLNIPLSTAITDGIEVVIEQSRYIVPIYSIREIVQVVPQDFTDLQQQGRVARIRENLIPVIDLKDTLGQINWDQMDDMKVSNANKNNVTSLREQRDETMLIVIESIHGLMALPVDDVLGQAQVVIKPLSTGQSIPEVAGAAIMGDGRTVLILDPSALVAKRQGGMAA